ncbi:MAG: hypothetical protein P1P82_16405 [Bacteroidales bacterium]|nr:hypothetical protein [Bacteroidales bacterium]
MRSFVITVSSNYSINPLFWVLPIHQPNHPLQNHSLKQHIVKVVQITAGCLDSRAIVIKLMKKEKSVSASDWDEVRRKVRSKFGEKLGGKLVIEDDYGRITEEIVAWMFLEPEITMEEIAQRINKSQSTVEKTKKKLREDEILERVGSTKAGYWKINF